MISLKTHGDWCRNSAPNKRSVKEMAKQSSNEAMGKEDQQHPSSRNKFGNEMADEAHYLRRSEHLELIER